MKVRHFWFVRQLIFSIGAVSGSIFSLNFQVTKQFIYFVHFKGQANMQQVYFSQKERPLIQHLQSERTPQVLFYSQARII